jgi:hypothetical protein
MKGNFVHINTENARKYTEKVKAGNFAETTKNESERRYV